MDDMPFRNGQPPPVDPPAQPPHNPPVDNERLAKLEGAYDTLKVVRPMTLTVLGLFLAALVFVLGVLANQIRDVSLQIHDVTGQVHDLNAKVDAIPVQLREEFRAMRAETAAQTSAIANSITATRQVQPQILVLPPALPAPAK
jgi:outer membrane murein-binding lipoprotein Lpp